MNYPTILTVPVAFVHRPTFEKYLKTQNFKFKIKRLQIVESRGKARYPSYHIEIEKPMAAFWIGANSIVK